MIDLSPYLPFLNSIETEKNERIEELIQWCEINTGTFHVEGIERFSKKLEKKGKELGASCCYHSIDPYLVFNKDHKAKYRPLASVLRIEKKRKAPSVLLMAHLDTVFEKDSPFQKVSSLKEGVLQGPGIADIKGGIAIIFWALKHFEASPFAKNLSWEILLNPDEEIGSKSSEAIIKKQAKKHQLGFVFEPCMEDGSLVSSRKGSCNLSIKVEGKASHAGRYFDQGINALKILAEILTEFCSKAPASVNVNIGKIDGGEGANIVASKGLGLLNLRSFSVEDLQKSLRLLNSLCQKKEKESKGKILQHIHSYRSPKPLTKDIKNCMQEVENVYQALNYPLHWQQSGGVCDGNTLFEAGLCNLDTLGVRGGGLHTHEEYCYVDSLVEKVKILFVLLAELSKKS